jgi:hypothetical protein
MCYSGRMTKSKVTLIRRRAVGIQVFGGGRSSPTAHLKETGMEEK